MTQPPEGAPGSTPDPQYGGWSPPPAPQPGWPQQPPPAAPSWPQQPPEQLVWSPPSSASPPSGQWEQLGAQPDGPQHSRGRSRGKLIGAAVVAVAVVAGGTATYVALSDKNSTGTSSPKQAISSIVDDLNKSDLVAALDDLPPGERDALSKPFTEEISQLKRLGVLTSDADPSNLSGVTFHLADLTFAGKPTAVSSTVALVQVTGGTLDVSTDATKIPFTSQLLKTAFPNGLPASSKSTQHIDIAAQERKVGQPLRLAAQKVGDKWYPSLFYTVAAAAARDGGTTTLTAGDRIPAVGAASPQQAVSAEIKALASGDYKTAIQLTSPTEMAALHDYGGVVLANATRPGASGSFAIDDMQFTTKNLPDGSVRVMLHSISVHAGSGPGAHDVQVTLSGNCVDVTVDAQPVHLCASDLITEIVQGLGSFGAQINPTAAQRQALVDLFNGVSAIGVDTTKIGGQWYVDPVRSFLDVGTAELSGLKDNDVIELIGFFRSLGN